MTYYGLFVLLTQLFNTHLLKLPKKKLFDTTLDIYSRGLYSPDRTVRCRVDLGQKPRPQDYTL